MNDSYGTRSLREITRIIFQHWFMMLFLLVVLAGGTYLACETIVPRTYRSQISLIFKRPQNKNPLSTETVGERVLEVFVKAQQQIVMSDLVLARSKAIAEDSNLRKKWKAIAIRWEGARQKPNGNVSEVAKEIHDFLYTGPVLQRITTLLEKEQAEFNRFRKSVKLETPGGEQVAMTESFTITVDRPAKAGEADSYLLAKYAAEAIADMYMVRYQEIQEKLSDPAVKVMENVVADYQNDDVKVKQAAYEGFIKNNANDITGLEQLLKSGTEQGYQNIITEVRKNDATLALQLAREKSVGEVLSKALPDGTLNPGAVEKMSDEQVSAIIDSVPQDFLKEDVAFVELTKSIVTLAARLAKAQAQFLEESRDVQYLKQQMARGKRHLLMAIVGHSRGLSGRIAAREQQRVMNEKLMAETVGKQTGVQVKLAEYSRLKNDFEVSQKHLERLQQDLIDARANALRARESVSISKLDEASTPNVDRPVVPLTGVYTLAAFIVALLFGIALAFLADHFDHTLRTTTDAERYLGIPVLGTVKKRGRGLVIAT